MDASAQLHEKEDTLEEKYPFLECVEKKWEGNYHVVTYRDSVGRTWKISQDEPIGTNLIFLLLFFCTFLVPNLR